MWEKKNYAFFRSKDLMKGVDSFEILILKAI